MNSVDENEATATITDSDDPMFFTTADLLTMINGILKQNATEWNEKGGESVNVVDGSSSLPSSSSSSTNSECGGFELQRQLPNGTTRRADASDMALANFQSKLKQVRRERSGI